MKGTAKTRTQRRMEKRQAIILLLLVLVVSLASFTLGVIVGRRGAERDFAHKLKQTEKVLVAQAPVSAPVPVQKPESRSETEGTEVAVPQLEEETKLSFYDNLAKETAPLGSGINLAPATEEPVAEAVIKPPVDLPEQPIVKKDTQVIAKAPVPETPSPSPADNNEETQNQSMPQVVAKGSHAVQIGSFNSAGDAIALKQKMLDKDYPAFVVEADLGDKGLWYRVRIGPYADVAKAKAALKILEDKEKMKGFVSRQK